MTVVDIALIAFGVAIGATGIGGVAVVPLLVQLADLPLRMAVPMAMAAFVVTGCVGSIAHLRAMPLIQRSTLELVGLTCLGATAGAVAFPLLSGVWIEVALGLLMVVVGGIELFPRRPSMPPETGSSAEAPPWYLVGSVVGFGSAITGTGGPVIFVPWMLALRLNVREVIALAQLIQVPIAGAATSAYLVQGALAVDSAANLALLLGSGTALGGFLATRLPVTYLRRALGCALVLGGVTFIAIKFT